MRTRLPLSVLSRAAARASTLRPRAGAWRRRRLWSAASAARAWWVSRTCACTWTASTRQAKVLFLLVLEVVWAGEFVLCVCVCVVVCVCVWGGGLSLEERPGSAGWAPLLLRMPFPKHTNTDADHKTSARPLQKYWPTYLVLDILQKVGALRLHATATAAVAGPGPGWGCHRLRSGWRAGPGSCHTHSPPTPTPPPPNPLRCSTAPTPHARHLWSCARATTCRR